MILACHNLEKSFGDQVIVRHGSFHIEDHEKAALTGLNGAGKSTILKMITGEIPADSGDIILAKGKQLGYLSQHPMTDSTRTVYEEMQTSKQYLIDMESQIRKIEAELQTLSGSHLEDRLAAYHNLTSRFERENGYAYQSEITGVLKGLGFTEEDFEKPVASLSGGQRTRVSLGKLLLTKPDILLLDEPTNHLDLHSIAWLETYLLNYPGAVLIVSHDRYFLNRVVTKIIEIEAGTLTMYLGNYQEFAKKKQMLRDARLKEYLNQQQEIKHQEAVITKLKQFNREKSIKRAESREKMLDKIEVLDKPTEVASEMRLTLEPSVESGNDVLTVTHLAKSFGTNCLFQDLDFDIKRGEKVALIGGNGTGKTTILKMVNHLVPKDAGTIALGSRVHIGYYDQEHQVLSLHKTIFEEISDAYPDLTNTKIRNVLAAFLFTGDDVFKKIEDLSGGERGRVSLAKLMLSPANFLILDEPTNHLDIQSKGILEDAIRSYTGTVFVVSHDRYFINRIATRILELKGKQLYSFIGNYDYYESHKDQVYEAAAPKQTDTSADTVTAPSATPSGKDDYKKQKEEQARLRKKENDIKKTEQKIEETEAAIAQIDEEFLNPEYATNSAKLGELSKKREELEETLSALYETWETLLA